MVSISLFKPNFTVTMNESSEYLDMSEEEFLDEFPFAPGPNDPDSQVNFD